MRFMMMGFAVLALAGAAQGQFFTDDFNSGSAKPEWSNSTTTTSPNGTAFLGRFNNMSVDLSLTGLGTHTSVLLQFRLFIINTMDGTEQFIAARVINDDLGSGRARRGGGSRDRRTRPAVGPQRASDDRGRWRGRRTSRIRSSGSGPITITRDRRSPGPTARFPTTATWNSSTG